MQRRHFRFILRHFTLRHAIFADRYQDTTIRAIVTSTLLLLAAACRHATRLFGAISSTHARHLISLTNTTRRLPAYDAAISII